MKNCRRKVIFALCALLMLTAVGSGVARAQQPPPGDQPPSFDVSGKWNFYVKNWDGQTHTDPVELTQNGTTLTGHFKGPNQSGSLEGTVNGRQFFFRTKTRHPLGFRGRIQDNNSMAGHYHVEGKEGTWEARRAD